MCSPHGFQRLEFFNTSSFSLQPLMLQASRSAGRLRPETEKQTLIRWQLTKHRQLYRFQGFKGYLAKTWKYDDFFGTFALLNLWEILVSNIFHVETCLDISCSRTFTACLDLGKRQGTSRYSRKASNHHLWREQLWWRGDVIRQLMWHVTCITCLFCRESQPRG